MNAVPTSSPSDPRASLAHQTRQLRHNLQTPIPALRVAFERKISLRFPHFQGFLTEYSSNISITGMFVRSQEPQQPGTFVEFEFTLVDGLRLIRGAGEVVWIRRHDAGPDSPAGMGIRFLRLDAESRRLIRWAVEKQLHQGFRLFDLDDGDLDVGDVETANDEAGVHRPPPDSAVDPGRLHPYAGYAVARQAPWRERLSAAASGLLPVALLIWAIHVSSPNRDSAAITSVAVEPVEAVEAATAPIKPAVPSAAEGMIAATEAWAEAWARQRPADYLDCYSTTFRPPQSLSLSAWQAQRRERITQPDFIQVGISALEVELLAPGRGRATFDQVYRSDEFRDATRKTLEWVQEDGRWRILEERAAG